MTTASILIVEDEPVLRELLLMALDDLDVMTTAVGTATLGIEVLSEQRWAVLITDIQTPGNIDGWQLAWTAYHKHPQLATIITSGSSNYYDKPLPPNACFIQKPWLLTEIIAMIETRLNTYEA